MISRCKSFTVNIFYQSYNDIAGRKTKECIQCVALPANPARLHLVLLQMSVCDTGQGSICWVYSDCVNFDIFSFTSASDRSVDQSDLLIVTVAE
jgi:hypothetical protein